MLSRSKKVQRDQITKRSQMYLDSKDVNRKQYKILSAVAFISIIVILILYKMGLFSTKNKAKYIVGSTTQKLEESTNKILSAWGSAGEALKFANLPSTAQGYLTVNAMVIQQDKSVKKQDIQIFYREASKLNPAGFGIANKLQHLNNGLKLGNQLMGGIKKGMQALDAIKRAKQSLKAPHNQINPKAALADESMDDYVVNKELTLVFLHGSTYVSSTWDELGTLDYFANLGYKMYGIDMPGYGHSQKVTVKSNEWLIDVIIKLISSQDEEGNIDRDGGEHHTDSHEKNKDAIKNDVAPSSKKIHKIAIISPDISGIYTLELLGNHKEKLGAKQGLMFEKYVSVAMDIALTKEAQNTDVKVCNIVGEDDVELENNKVFGGMENAQTVRIKGASKHVYLDKPEIFHNIISTFLATGQCKVDFSKEMEKIKTLEQEYKDVNDHVVDAHAKSAQPPV